MSTTRPIKPVKTEQPDTIKALRGANIIMILQAIMMFALFLAPTESFLRPTTPPDPFWISLAFGPHFEVWDLMFPLVAGSLLYATVKLRRMTEAHLLSSGVWIILGSLWILGDYMGGEVGYLFGAGLFAVFISALHVAVMNIWRAEGVS